jgi:hypothetical protein
MKGQILKIPTGVARRGEVWCEPLKVHFPQVYRVIRRRASLSSTTSASMHPQTVFASDFSLFNLEDNFNGAAKSIPLRHLTPLDDRSLIIRHHWSELLANTYLRAVEDIDSNHSCGAICESEEAVFTIVTCRTRKSWPGPMIFYLADFFEDDSDIGVQIWERSIGVDGELQSTDIFYNDD